MDGSSVTEEPQDEPPDPSRMLRALGRRLRLHGWGDWRCGADGQCGAVVVADPAEFRKRALNSSPFSDVIAVKLYVVDVAPRIEDQRQ
jgi:hypothetical protein